MIPSIWLFSGDRGNVRYCLGEAKKKNILVIGVNPGMSMPGEKQVTTRNAVKVIYKTIGNKCTWYYYDKLTHKIQNIRVAHNMTNHTESWKISQCLII